VDADSRRPSSVTKSVVKELSYRYIYYKTI